jgi:DNA repair protein RecO (recombination protein O)
MMICSTPAFVLRTYDFRETSKIVNFYTRDFGKIKGILKGIRKDPRKFGSTLPLLSLNHIIFYKKRTTEIHLVSHCDLIDDFGLTRGNLEGLGFSHYASELVDALMPLEDANKSVFELVFDFLNSLKEVPDRDMRLAFQIKSLTLSGFKPHFDSCLSCEKKLTKDAFFSHARGGLLCGRCLFEDKNAETILPGAIASMLYIEKATWARCLRLAMHERVRHQLSGFLEGFIRFHIGRSMKTQPLVHQILDLCA